MQIFKRKNRTHYYARWQSQGKDFLRSTGETSERRALEAAKRLRAEEEGKLQIDDELERLTTWLQNHQPTSPKERRETVEKLVSLLHAMITGESEPNQQTLRSQVVRQIQLGQQERTAVVEGWKAWSENSNRKYEPKASTLLGYHAVWRRFEAWAIRRGIQFLHEVSVDECAHYATDLWKSKVSPSTFNQHIAFLRAMFALLEKEAGISSNPWLKINKKQKNKGEGRRNLSEEELKKVLAAAQGNLRLMVYVGLFTGLRLGDVVNLRWQNIEYDAWKREARPGFILVKPLKTQRMDNKVEIPIHPSLSAQLKEYRGTSAAADFVFPKEQEGWRKNSANLTHSIQALFESCGIQTTEKAEHGHRRRVIVRVGFHSLRHSFVSLCAKAKTPLHIIQKIVGHSSPAMTDHYTHSDSEQRRDAINALPGFTIDCVKPAEGASAQGSPCPPDSPSRSSSDLE